MSGGGISYAQEIKRKAIHMLSLTIPICYWFLTKMEAIYILAPITLIALIFDIGRHNNEAINNFCNKFFGNILREHEKGKGLSGATPLLLAALLCIALFPKIIAISAIAILVICDTAAALVGRKWGRIKFLGKSLEGTLAFIFSGIAVIYIIKTLANESQDFFIYGCLATIIAALLEVFSKKLHVDDNYSIPISFAVALWVFLYV